MYLLFIKSFQFYLILKRYARVLSRGKLCFFVKTNKQTSNYLSKKHIFQPAIFTTKRKQNKPTSVAVLLLSRVRVSLSLAFNHTYSHTSIWSDS